MSNCYDSKRDAALTFKPINPRNAIQEMVFMVNLSRPHLEREAEAIKAIHGELAAELPRLRMINSLQITTNPNQELPAAPLEMLRFRTDGTVSRRLSVGQNRIVVNELEYTRWNEISATALRLLRRATLVSVSGVSSPPPTPLAIRSLALQVLDRFAWEGDDTTFNLSQALSQPNERLPSAVWTATDTWTSTYQFTKREKGRSFVDRTTFSVGKFPPDKRIKVQIDNVQDCQFGMLVEPSVLMAEDAPELKNIFDDLHDRNKKLLRSSLTSFLVDSIGLNNA